MASTPADEGATGVAREAAWPPSLLRVRHLDLVLFAGALALFIATRLIGIERWPIYFFTDEAVQTVLAEHLVRNGFRDESGRLLPTYFENGPYFNLSISVYAQVIPYELFGFSLFWTRATSALIALAGTAAVGLILRDVFRLRFWWVGALLLSITPAWFLHSRTAFETVIAVSFFAWALYFYLRYRTGTPWLLLPAVFFAALAFYSYSASQLSIIATAALLLLSDARYHWQRRRFVLAAAILAAIVALPYLRFRLQQSDEVYLHLRTLGSYWLNDDLSTGDKLREFWSEYRQGLSPRYWYGRYDVGDLPRHQMRGWGFLWWPTLPFTGLGLVVCLWNFRSSPHRAVLLALLAAPLGGAMVAIGITRVLILVVPAALLAAIGMETVLRLTLRRVRYEVVALAAFTALATVNALMLRSALVDGPRWYTDYGLYGMQFGARQVAAGAEEVWRENAEARVLISPTWTNGGDAVFYHLLDGDTRFELAGLEAFRSGQRPIPETGIVFVLTGEEYARVERDSAFEDVTVRKTIRAPDGTDAFHFVELRVSAQAALIAELERLDRLRTVTGRVSIGGESVEMTRSQFDIGSTEALFDNDTFTLGRTREGNPVRFELTFPAPHTFSGLRMTLGAHAIDLAVALYRSDGRRAALYEASYENPNTNLEVDLPFENTPADIARVVITIRDTQESAEHHIHIHEMDLVE
jgi:4-amino-4-deoxy-L-arabinose transferase-like glycosyltransferase